MISKDIPKISKKIVLKILLSFVMLASVFIITFIILGYYTASRPISYLPIVHSDDLRPNPNVLLNPKELKVFRYKDGSTKIWADSSKNEDIFKSEMDLALNKSLEEGL